MTANLNIYDEKSTVFYYYYYYYLKKVGYARPGESN